MTKTLKRRFIMFTMTAVTCLLIFIVLAINSLNWMMLERQSDTVLETIVDADGTFHKMDFDRPPPFSRPLDMDRMRASRFFIVRSDLSGNIIDVNIDQISAIDHETAKSYALEVMKADDTSGRVHGYKYAVKQLGPNKLTFFMDTSEQSESFRMVLFVSTAIAVLCWVILLIIVILLSGKVIRPVLVGMEKQKQFITNAGHEMKTPLAIIQSNNDTMVLIHGENKYNVHIRNQTKRLNVLIIFVAHPKKPQEKGKVPTMYDISGSADWYNMADYGIIVHRERKDDGSLENNMRIIVEKVKDFQLGNPAGGEIHLIFNRDNYKLEEND